MNGYMHGLVGAYALNAMDPDERHEFEEHLAQCADCRDELGGFLETAGRLGAATESPAPPRLKATVMAAVSRTPQERPVVVPAERPSRLRRNLPRVALAAALVAVIVSVGGAIVEHNRAEDLSRQQASVAAVLSAPDADTVSSKVKQGGMIRLVASHQLDKAVLVTRGLSKLDDSHDYQMWTIGEGGPQSAGVVPGQRQLVSRTHLMAGIDAAKAVAITVEPAGGSKQPTTKPIATLAVG